MEKLPLLAMILFWNTVIVILVTQTIPWRWIRVEVISLEDNEGSLNLFASGHDPFFRISNPTVSVDAMSSLSYSIKFKRNV